MEIALEVIILCLLSSSDKTFKISYSLVWFLLGEIISGFFKYS